MPRQNSIPRPTKDKTKTENVASMVTKAKIENAALMLAAVLEDSATPPRLRRYIRHGLSEVYNYLDDNEAVTDSAEYITLLFTRHAEESEGGAR